MAHANQPPRENLVRAMNDIGLRSADDGGMPSLIGHFAVWNQWTEIRSAYEGNFMEQFAPRSMDKTLRESVPKVLFNHGKDPSVGDKVLGTVTSISPDATGAAFDVALFDTSYNRDLIPGLEARVYGSSIRFKVVNQKFDRHPARSEYNPRGIPERIVTEAQVAEFGPVTFPAYAGATAGLRSMTDYFLLDDLAEDPEHLAELIAHRRSRTFTATAPNVRVTFGPKDQQRDEERVDAEDLDCLGQMLALGSQYIAEQDESDDADNVPKMEAVLAGIGALVPVEVAEDEPADDDYEANSADVPADAEEREISEPVTPTADTTPSTTTTEPEPSVATTRAKRATTTRSGLYIPTRKDRQLWDRL